MTLRYHTHGKESSSDSAGVKADTESVADQTHLVYSVVCELNISDLESLTVFCFLEDSYEKA
jgi:hypothetical protein